MADDQIVLCFDCGTKNRIRRNIDGMPKCGNCGVALPLPQADGHSTWGPTPKCNHRPADAQEHASNGTRARPAADGWMPLLALAMIAGLSLAAWWQGSAESQAASSQAPTGSGGGAQAHLSPSPIYQYPGVIYNRTGREPVAPLQIVTQPGRDYYVKLVDLATGLDDVGIYVNGGRNVEVLIPLGSYEMRYASGQTWYGFPSLFGPKTTYAKSNSRFDFAVERGAYRRYTVELILQTNGNLRTFTIRPEQF